MRGSSPSPEQVRAVLAGGGLGCHVQPIADLARGVAVGYEALTRFPDRGPLEWFAAARRHGLGAELEAAAIRTALARRAELPVNTFLTVNVGPDMLLTEPVRAAFDAVMPLGGVVVELTEQVPIEDYLRLEPTLLRLRSAGALVAIDDAGAGYAGLRHLLTLRPDIIKLDRGLVSGVDTDEAKRALIEMVGTFAGRIDAWLLAEGIETGEELDVLAGLGVPLAQGYHLGRPKPDFRALDADAATRAVLATARASRGAGSVSTVRQLLEFATTATSAADATTLLGSSEVEFVVVLDEHGHPRGVVDSGGLVHAIRDSGLRVNVDTPVAMAAQRAIVRTPAQRFQPLVCTDNAGRYVGVVRIERVLDCLARAASGAFDHHRVPGPQAGVG